MFCVLSYPALCHINKLNGQQIFLCEHDTAGLISFYWVVVL